MRAGAPLTSSQIAKLFISYHDVLPWEPLEVQSDEEQESLIPQPNFWSPGIVNAKQGIKGWGAEVQDEGDLDKFGDSEERLDQLIDSNNDL